MKTFRDTAGREWAITIDVNAIKRVMKSSFDYLGEPLKVNLLALVEPDSDLLLKKVVEYPPLACDIAYALCKPQCDEKNITDEDFGRAMGGDVLEKVLECILEETVDFFPLGRRAVLKKVLEKSQTFAEKAKTLMADTTGGRGTGCSDRCNPGARTGAYEKTRTTRKSTPDDWYWYCFELAGIIGIDPGPQNPR